MAGKMEEEMEKYNAFCAAVKKEGAGAEFLERVEQLVSQNRNKPLVARKQAMEEFSYCLPVEEEDFPEEENTDKVEKNEKKAVERVERNLLLPAMRGLPAVADPVAEMEWVSGHPAMMRADLLGVKGQRVQIRADDINRAPHGRAPSRRAVNSLINWVNRPDKFHDQIMGQLKKSGTEHTKEEAEKDVDPSLSEVRKYIEELRKSV